MKLFSKISLVLLALFILNCKGNQEPEVKTVEVAGEETATVMDPTVDFDKKLAMVVYNEAMINPEFLTETVTKAGEAYKVSDMKTEDFTAETANKKECKPGCKMACCNKETKAESSASVEKPMGCKKDCKMPCCAGKV